MYYIKAIHTNCNVFYLTVCKTRCEGPCTSGFLPLSNQLFRPDETIIFPALHFTSPGNVLSWQFAAIERPGSSSSMPHIQIWRPCPMRGTLPTDTDTVPCYNLIHSTSRQNIMPKIEEGNDNVYTYQLDSEMQVRVGDVVGVQQAQDSRLLLALRGQNSSSFVTGFNSNVIRSNTNQVMRPLPLLRPASSESKLMCISYIRTPNLHLQQPLLCHLHSHGPHQPPISHLRHLLSKNHIYMYRMAYIMFFIDIKDV